MRIFLCGDVMTGRGIDQALPHPVNPNLYEPYVRDAREYVALAEKANGPIPRPLSFDYIWGNALPELERAEVDLRIANLETAVTSAETPWPEKGIHYRMHPQNIGCLTAAQISACALANNHVLDWGYDGLSETLKTLRRGRHRARRRGQRCRRSDAACSAQHAWQWPPAVILIWIKNQRDPARLEGHQHFPGSKSAR